MGDLLAPASDSGTFSKFLLGENGVAVRGAIRSVSASMRSDTQQRLPVLPGLAREDGCTGSEARPGGLWVLWVAETRKELVRWFSLKALAV